MRSKKFKSGVMWACAGVALFVAAITVIDIMVPSYIDWRTYYDAAIKERDEQKYLNSLPFEFLGISAQLAEGVEYYKNGKAAPTNDDFRVVAHFTEKGKDFDEILRAGDFEIVYPENFATDGGNVTVSYSYMPEQQGEEPVEPIVKTAEVSVALLDVLPVSLSITELPYRVAYAAGATFDMDGIAGEVRYNDGTVLEVTKKELSTAATTLADGVDSVDVSWSNGGETLTAAVPVSVSADYTDGNIVSLQQEGRYYIEEGQLLAEATPSIRAIYENGNRLPLSPEDYTVTGNVETASFTNNCILTVTAKNSPNAWCRFAATVSSGIEAEELSGFTPSEVDSVTVEDGEFVDAGKVSGVKPAMGDQFTFTVSSAAVSKPELMITLSNRALAEDGENLTAQDIKLADIFTLEVNGRSVAIPESAVLHGYTLPAAEAGKYLFEECALPSVVLNKNESNSVTLTVREGADVFVDRISLETGYKGKFYASVDDLVAEAAAAGVDAQMDVATLRNWDGVYADADTEQKTRLANYAHGMCTDGTYIYLAATSYSSTLRRVVVTRIDPATGEVNATSQRTPVGMTTEDYAGIAYYNGMIIIFDDEGGAYFVDAATFSSTSAFWPYKDFAFEGLEDSALKDVSYSAANDKFAVLAGSNVYLFDGNMKAAGSVSFSAQEGKIKRMTATDKYIYVITSGDGISNANIYVVDWNGNYIGKTVVDNSSQLTDINTAKSSIQGIVSYGDSLYFTIATWGQSFTDSFKVIKASLPTVPDSITPQLTVDEYLNACADNDASPVLKAAPLLGTNGNIGGRNYAMGVAFDGEYMYYSNNDGSNTKTDIYKATLDGTIVATSAQFTISASPAGTTGNPGDNARLFVMGDKLYVIGINGENKIYSIKLSEFTDGCTLTPDNSLPEAVSAHPFDIHYSEANNKFAVINTSKQFSIYNADGTEVAVSRQPSYSGMKVSSITGNDDYIFISYSVNAQKVVPIDMYDWNGNYITTLGVNSASGEYNMGDVVKNSYNMQSICVADGKIYMTICSWANTRIFVWTITPDLSVFA